MISTDLLISIIMVISVTKYYQYMYKKEFGLHYMGRGKRESLGGGGGGGGGWGEGGKRL